MELLLRELNKWMKIKVKKSKIENFTLFVFRKTLCNSAVVQCTEKIIWGPIWEYGRIVYKKTWIYFQLYLFMYIYITYIPFFCSIKKTDKHQHAQFHGPILIKVYYMYIYKVVISVLFGFLVKTQKPLGPIYLKFWLGNSGEPWKCSLLDFEILSWIETF